MEAVARPRRNLFDQLAYGLDGFCCAQLKKLAPDDDPTERLRELRQVHAELKNSGALQNDSLLFPEPERTKIRKRLLAPHRVGFYDWRWQSRHPLIFPEIEDDYRSRRANQGASLRLLKLRPRGSTMAIVINGFSSGHHIIERLAWPIQLFRCHGIGSALYALPFHGARARVFPPEWPGADLRMLIEGFRQAIWDLRIAIRALREQGVARVGVMGMSLGGYTSALLATVTPDVDFVVPYVPIASISDFMEDNQLVPASGELKTELTEAFRKHMSVISPLSRRARIPAERITVISGELDQLATVDHGAKLSEHLGARHLVFRGAHVIQKGRARAFKETFEDFKRNGILP